MATLFGLVRGLAVTIFSAALISRQHFSSVFLISFGFRCATCHACHGTCFLKETDQFCYALR